MADDGRRISLSSAEWRGAIRAAALHCCSTEKHVYGIRGIAELFGCSIPTANRIKASGKIDQAITQIGRKIIVDADLAFELAGRKTGGRKVRSRDIL